MRSYMLLTLFLKSIICNHNNNVYGVIIGGVLDWVLHLLTTYTRDTAYAKSLPACCVFASRSLVTASNIEDSSAAALKSSPNGGSLQLLTLYSLLYRTDLVAAIVFLITLRADNPVHSRMLTVYAGTCLPSRSLAAAVCSCLLRICCLATDVVPLSVSRPLPRNECCFKVVH
jgi:hypothetical protein